MDAFHFNLPWECCSFLIQWLTRWLKKNLYRIHVFSLEQKSRWKILRAENSRNVIFHYSIQLPSTQSWWGNNTNTIFLCLCIIPPVQKASLKLALSVISNDTNDVIFNFKGPVYCTKNLKLMIQASKLRMSKPQELIFQHPLEPEASPEGQMLQTITF